MARSSTEAIVLPAFLSDCLSIRQKPRQSEPTSICCFQEKTCSGRMNEYFAMCSAFGKGEQSIRHQSLQRNDAIEDTRGQIRGGEHRQGLGKVEIADMPIGGKHLHFPQHEIVKVQCQ